MRTSAKYKLKNIFLKHNAGNNFLTGVGDSKNARKILKLDSSSIAKSIIKLDNVMRVGIDLDNTIINYSKVFLKICNKYNLKINKENPKVKLKTYLRKNISREEMD